MPFPPHKPTLTAGQDAYILDPDPSFPAQYRCRIRSVDPLIINLYPDANIEPDFHTLPSQYHLAQPDVTPDQIYLVPLIQPAVMGYAEALRQHNDDPGDWDWAPAAASPFAGIEGANTSRSKTEGQIEPPTQEKLTPPPGEVFQVQAGEVLEVIQTDHSFWKNHAGKDALVLQVPDGGDIITVEIDGLPFPNIEVGRFKRKGDPVRGPEQSDLEKTVAADVPWIGKAVHVKDAKIDSSFRGICETMTDEGIKLKGIDTPIPWDRVGSICPMDQEPTPGDPQEEARIAKMKADEAATLDQVMQEIHLIIGGRAEKETFGKKEYRQMIDRWELLKKKVVPNIPAQAMMAEIDALLLNDKVAQRETLGKREYRPLVEKWGAFMGAFSAPTTPSEPVQQTLLGTESSAAAIIPDQTQLDEAYNQGCEAGYKKACKDIKDHIDQMSSR